MGTFLMDICGSCFLLSVRVTILHLILSLSRNSFKLGLLLFVSTFFHLVDSLFFLFDELLLGFTFGFALSLNYLVLLLLLLMFYHLLCFLLL